MEYTGNIKWIVLLVLSLALAIIVIDTTLLNVALSAIIKDLGTTLQSIQWVITVYALMLAAFTITGGRLGDLFGRKRMFVLGAIIFAFGSLLASYSHSVLVLLLGESIIEGVGAALMMPATASLLVASFEGRERAIAFGVWGGVAAASSAIGPILGGYLTSHYSWRWGFRINVFVVLILLIGSFLVRESRDRAEKRELDGFGVLLSALGLLSLVFGIIESSTYGWWKSMEPFEIFGRTFTLGGYSIVPFTLLLGVLFLIGFILWEQRRERAGRTPLISMKLFKNRQFATSILTLGVLTLGMTGIIFVIPVFLQAVRGLDAYHTGLALLPLSLALLIASPSAAAISKWVMPRTLIQVGIVVNVLALFLLKAVLAPTMPTNALILPLALYGLGMGLIISQINNLALSAVSVQQSGEASGLNNTFRQVGASLGAAIIGAVMIAFIRTNLPASIEQSPFIPEPVKIRFGSISPRDVSSIQFGGSAGSSQTPGVVQDEISIISHRVTVNANKRAMSYTIFFAILTFFISFTLPRTRLVGAGSQAGSGPREDSA